MTTYAKLRDYREGDCFPYITGYGEIKYCAGDDFSWFECWLPDAIENEEFNLVILLGDLPVRVQSINFDFEER